MSASGYGNIENRKLRILVLGAPRRRLDSEAIARALSARHEVTVHSPRRGGVWGSLKSAHIANTFKPDLIHVIGSEGAAESGVSIAKGIGIPVVASLDKDDLFQGTAENMARVADAIVVESGEAANAFRIAGIRRDMYVVSCPDRDPGPSDGMFLGAIEVIYGRVVPPVESDGLVRIGRTPS